SPSFDSVHVSSVGITPTTSSRLETSTPINVVAFSIGLHTLSEDRSRLGPFSQMRVSRTLVDVRAPGEMTTDAWPLLSLGTFSPVTPGSRIRGPLSKSRPIAEPGQVDTSYRFPPPRSR